MMTVIYHCCSSDDSSYSLLSSSSIVSHSVMLASWLVTPCGMTGGTSLGSGPREFPDKSCSAKKNPNIYKVVCGWHRGIDHRVIELTSALGHSKFIMINLNINFVNC